MKPHNIHTATFAIIALVSIQTHASIGVPYSNLSPLIGQLPQTDFALIDPNMDAPLFYRAEVSVANYLNSRSRNGVLYQIDGETTLIRQTIAYRFDSAFIGLELPWQSHSGGVLDQAIYDFHDVFGMPQNGRTTFNQDQLNWTITGGNGSAFSLNSSSSALADIRIFAEFQLDNSPAISLRATAHLPTGDKSDRTGTNAFGLSMSLLSQNTIEQLFFGLDLNYWYGVGFTMIEAPSYLDDLGINKLVGDGLFGASLGITDDWGVSVQLNTNSPYFDNQIRELGWIPVIATLATDLRFGGTEFSLGFSEDLRPGTSPDFSIFLAISRAFL